ncbi:MAG TPA: aldehyde dehydrogenase family protein, partial [Dehalococcoidia bacterium]|nr:aldehyde dehydrogenase family protein [Dehalococcoidia bacterium]
SLASQAQIERAVAVAGQAFREYRRLPAHRRSQMLLSVSHALQERGEELARLIAQEVGKPIRTARLEAARAVQTFRLAAEEAGRLYGEAIPMDIVPAGEGRTGYYIRQPIGVVAAITPFNFPLNLVAHKVAPALAAGNTVVHKPASHCPLTALELGKLLVEAGFPPGAVSVLPCPGSQADVLVESPQVAMISFTGSTAVGREIRSRAGLKRVALELGSNAANIVCPSADLDRAAEALAIGGFAYAGQVCLSVQRVYVQRSIWGPFLERFLPRVESLKVGDPLEETTDLGPMIAEEEARRAEDWIAEALEGGAKLLLGGNRRKGAFLRPAVLTNTHTQMRVMREEVFAPVVSLTPYDTFPEAVALANDSRYGLNAAVFTQDLAEAIQAVEELEAGSVIINDSSAYRADHMPYGGVKESGLGREGVRFAMQAMTEIKFACIRL